MTTTQTPCLGVAQQSMGLWDTAFTIRGVAAEPLDPTTARAMQGAGDVVVDVRDPDEYASGHIAGAVNIPIGTLPAALEQLVPTGQVITTCSMGGRAEKAARLLDLAGRDAFWVAGGTKAWAAAGHDVVRGPLPG